MNPCSRHHTSCLFYSGNSLLHVSFLLLHILKYLLDSPFARIQDPSFFDSICVLLRLRSLFINSSFCLLPFIYSSLCSRLLTFSSSWTSLFNLFFYSSLHSFCSPSYVSVTPSSSQHIAKITTNHYNCPNKKTTACITYWISTHLTTQSNTHIFPKIDGMTALPLFLLPDSLFLNVRCIAIVRVTYLVFFLVFFLCIVWFLWICIDYCCSLCWRCWCCCGTCWLYIMNMFYTISPQTLTIKGEMRSAADVYIYILYI